ncbi:MAG: PIN domain-containing protein [Gammaproteobacteria bacterium]|nr:PIN domain-containing protein [Gammaproteobacteria bacterium]
MTERFFVDTHVFVYARDAGEAEKQPGAAAWLEWLWHERLGRISYQVLIEYYQVVTRKLSPGLDIETARQDVRDLLAWRPVAVDDAVLEQAWQVQDRFSLSWWDALIVGAAQRAGCRYLLSEDLQAGQDLDGIIVVDPFESSPAGLMRIQE